MPFTNPCPSSIKFCRAANRSARLAVERALGDDEVDSRPHFQPQAPVGIAHPAALSGAAAQVTWDALAPHDSVEEAEHQETQVVRADGADRATCQQAGHSMRV